MLRLGRMTDYAIVLLDGLERGAWRSASDLAAGAGVPAPAAARALRRLARAGLVESRRGASGGYRLARPPESLTVADAVRAMEGPIALTRCVEGAPDSCRTAPLCPMRGRWNAANAALESALEGMTLASLRAPGPGAAPSARAPGAGARPS